MGKVYVLDVFRGLDELDDKRKRSHFFLLIVILFVIIVVFLGLNEQTVPREVQVLKSAELAPFEVETTH